MQLHVVFLEIQGLTPWNWLFSPENTPFQKTKSSCNHGFSRAYVVSGRVMVFDRKHHWKEYLRDGIKWFWSILTSTTSTHSQKPFVSGNVLDSNIHSMSRFCEKIKLKQQVRPLLPQQNAWTTFLSSNLIRARRLIFCPLNSCHHRLNHFQHHAKESCSSCNEGPQKQTKKETATLYLP